MFESAGVIIDLAESMRIDLRRDVGVVVEYGEVKLVTYFSWCNVLLVGGHADAVALFAFLEFRYPLQVQDSWLYCSDCKDIDQG